MKVPFEPIRIWRALAPDDIENSCVKKLVWSENGKLYALCGAEKEYVAAIENGTLAEIVPADQVEDSILELLNVKPFKISEDVKLPSYPGRQYKAKDYVATEFSDGRIIVGTADAFLAIVKNGKAFCLGSVAENGPVRCLTTNPEKTVLYGVVGDDEDLGSIFSYDDENGVIRHGIVNTEMISIGDTAAISLLSACAISPDGTLLAVGAGDRLGTVVLYEL